MDTTRFDGLTRWLGGRASRRTALGAALAGLGFALGDRATALEATPAATQADKGEKPVFMFVQTFAGGRGEANPDVGTPGAQGAPAPAGGANILLTLEGHSGQTIYFSDRPDRVVGAKPTEAFIDRFDFSAGNPPNAALVAEFASGQGVVVLELIEPTYDPDTGTLVYGAEVLEGYEGENLIPVLADQVAERLPAEFGPAALFIDDCPAIKSCYVEDVNVPWGVRYLGPVPEGPFAQCYNPYTLPECLPCDTTLNYLYSRCDVEYRVDCYWGNCWAGP